VLYVYSNHLEQPHDGLWHFGVWVPNLFGSQRRVDPELVKDHALGWVIKAFFLAFMASVFPEIVASVLRYTAATEKIDIFYVARLMIRVLFIFDVCFGLIGYIMTFRILDSHLRSANPYLSGCITALICYPPFILMSGKRPCDYRRAARTTPTGSTATSR